jgi:hypothetical protein
MTVVKSQVESRIEEIEKAREASRSLFEEASASTPWDWSTALGSKRVEKVDRIGARTSLPMDVVERMGVEKARECMKETLVSRLVQELLKRSDIFEIAVDKDIERQELIANISLRVVQHNKDKK